jgi:hypothetical protein
MAAAALIVTLVRISACLLVAACSLLVAACSLQQAIPLLLLLLLLLPLRLLHVYLLLPAQWSSPSPPLLQGAPAAAVLTPRACCTWALQAAAARTLGNLRCGACQP